MALINCYECGKEISDQAISCPNCGAPVQKNITIQEEAVNQQTAQGNILDEDAIKIRDDKRRKLDEEKKEKVRLRWEEQEKERTNKAELNTTGEAIGWITGVFLVLMALGSLTDGNIATSLICLVGAAFLLPSIRKKVYQKTQVVIPSAYRIGIVIAVLFFAMIASQRAEASRAEEAKQKLVEEQAKAELQAKEIKTKKFQSEKSNLLKQVQLQIYNNDYDNALPICNEYMYLQDKDLSPLCQQVKEEANKKAELERKKVAEEQKRQAAKEAARQETELKASMGSKAWKLHKKHPEWSIDDCQNVAKSKYWIGMTTEMMVASLGRPDSAKPSNYGNGRQWQYCYTDGWFQCLYDQNDDGIIDSYN